MTKKQKGIDPEKWYTISEMVEAQLFPWCKNFATYRRYILDDRKSRNYLKAVILGRGRQKVYRIKGENIIKFLVQVEDGSYHI